MIVEVNVTKRCIEKGKESVEVGVSKVERSCPVFLALQRLINKKAESTMWVGAYSLYFGPKERPHKIKHTKILADFINDFDLVTGRPVKPTKFKINIPKKYLKPRVYTGGKTFLGVDK